MLQKLNYVPEKNSSREGGKKSVFVRHCGGDGNSYRVLLLLEAV